MSTIAKAGLVAIVLVLIGVFGYTQLGSKPVDYAANEVPNQNTVTPPDQTSAMPAGSGDVDEASSVILSGATGEGIAVTGEEGDTFLIDNDKQESVDLGQTYTENDF